MIDRIRQRDASKSVRRCCRVLGFRRQTYYGRKRGHRPEEADDELAALLRKTCQDHPYWGFWKVFHFLRRDPQHNFNHKRMYRIWKREGLNLRRPPKRKRIHREYQALLAPDGINEGWAMDFVSDWMVGPAQKSVRLINIMDEGSRRALWTEAHTSISARKLIEVLDHVVEVRGCPQYIRCDNGPEFISRKLKTWATERNVELRFIQPGKPTQNGLIERLNKTLRAECLDLTWFTTLEELNEEFQSWSQTYNLDRPHQSLGHVTPAEHEIEHQKFYYSPVAA